MNKDALLESIHAGRDRWEKTIAKLTPERLTESTLFSGWSVKDLIAHVGAWERTAAAVFAALLNNQDPGFLINQISLDELNAQFYAEHRDQPLDDVLAVEQAAYRWFLNLVEGAAEADLFDADRFVWMNGNPFADWVAANTYEHYDEHLVDLSAWLDRHAPMAGNVSSPIRTQEIALRNAYVEGDPQRCAAHHLNLANHQEASGSEPTTFLAHRLAGGVLLFQADSDLYADALGDLAVSFVRFAPRQAPLPDSFDELARIVETIDGVRFREVVDRLSQDGGADGEEAVHAVAGMARMMAGV
jgi:hypothetical protein